MPIDPIAIAAADCRDLDNSSKLEWLETNGLGGFAMGTVSGANTRRYHGLLIASLRPPVERYVLLSKLEETLIVDGRRYDLSSNFYPGAVYPRGHELLSRFQLRPFPTFTWTVEGIEVEKRIFMPQGENTVVVEWQIRGGGGVCWLEVGPLMAFRDYHSTTHTNGGFNGSVEQSPGMASIRPYAGLPRLFLAHNAVTSDAGPGWYYNFEYPVELERGLDFSEDLYCPLVLTFDGGRTATVIASTEPHSADQAVRMRAVEEKRRERIAAGAPSDDALVQELALAADQYLVQRGDLKTVIAGYPWFSDWGRDTMIALPGLALVSGRYQIARDILRAFAGSIDQGMLPNRFPDAGETPEYNTVDATLWFFEAVRDYLARTDDGDFVREEIYPALKDIVNWHLRGTRFGIGVDHDGLLKAGVPGSQLTWMDAKIGDWVATPRHGKPVEIQALWYNALQVLFDLAVRFGDAEPRPVLAGLAERAAESFNRLFWNEERGCFYDVVGPDGPDRSVRPNQVIALSLPHIMASRERARSALGVIERELLTPKGLRTLAPSDPAYRGRYEGGPAQRDAMYHQGTVWPWLLGHYIAAYVRAYGHAPEIDPLRGELRSGCLGHIGEIYDGDAPHAGRGCPAQAWSVAEILRSLANSTRFRVQRFASVPCPTVECCLQKAEAELSSNPSARRWTKAASPRSA